MSVVQLKDLVSGLFVVTTRDQITGAFTGFMASWVQQVSFEPELLSLSLKSTRPGFEEISHFEPFTINILGEYQDEYMDIFCPASGKLKDQLPSNMFVELPDGTYALKHAKSTLYCQAVEMIKPGDHYVIIAKVLSGNNINEKMIPATHYREEAAAY